LAALALLVSPAYAQIELTESEPRDGARLDAPPGTIHLCFSELVSTFRPSYQKPDGHDLSLQISFQPDGRCLDILATLPEEPPMGEYTFNWQVTAVGGGEEESGTLRFRVETNGGPDILLTALITIAIAGGAAVLFTLGFLLRRRIGFEPHRPPEEREEGEGH
jgi:methionine-rich copper-binding protein CopC